MASRPKKNIERIVNEDGRYPIAAVQFVREGLSFAMGKIHGGEIGPSGRRHVSGPQVCEALRELAVHRWGLLAPKALKRWNIETTRDFGEIVFLMINNGWMQKEPTDSIDDFTDVYNFEEAFTKEIHLPDGG